MLANRASELLIVLGSVTKARSVEVGDRLRRIGSMSRGFCRTGERERVREWWCWERTRPLVGDGSLGGLANGWFSTDMFAAPGCSPCRADEESSSYIRVFGEMFAWRRREGETMAVEISRSCKRNEAPCTGSVLNERLTRRPNVNADAAGLAAEGR